MEPDACRSGERVGNLEQHAHTLAAEAGADTSGMDVEKFIDQLEAPASPQPVLERHRSRPEEPRLPSRATRSRVESIADQANKTHGGLPIGEHRRSR